jgi:hypothetical protein
MGGDVHWTAGIIGLREKEDDDKSAESDGCDGDIIHVSPVIIDADKPVDDDTHSNTK